MEIDIKKCKKVKYSSVGNAVFDLNLGKHFFTRKTSETLVKVDTPEDIQRYFYDLYCYPTFPDCM